MSNEPFGALTLVGRSKEGVRLGGFEAHYY